jgi:predicted MPP superfamily phosphohydrolase
MRATRRALPFLLCTLSIAAAGCGGDGGAPEAADAAEAGAREAPVYGATGPEILRVVPVEIEIVDIPPGWSGMRIATVSDLHLGVWEGNAATARAAMERAAAERPDLVVLLGDYVVEGSYEVLDRVLEPLRGMRVLAVLGDRDMAEQPRGPDSAQTRIREALTRNGVEVLVNERARVIRGGDTAFVAGIEPFTARRPDWRRAETWSAVGEAPSTVLVLSHMPVAAVTMPPDRYAAMLAGHAFCGRVEVPGTPRLSWLNTEVFPGTPEPASTRIYRVRGATLFVTCGIGFGYVPVRFGAPPEVALITLRAAGPAPADSAAAAGPEEMDLDSLIRAFTPDSAPGDTASGGEAET